MADRNEKSALFRQKTIDRISSPEQLTDYLRVTNPGVWIILAIIILLLGSLVAWSAIGTLETKTDVKVAVEDHTAVILSPDGTELAGGMSFHVSGQDAVIASAETDEYGRSVGRAEIALPDGVYDGTVVTETMRPIDFLLESR